MVFYIASISKALLDGGMCHNGEIITPYTVEKIKIIVTGIPCLQRLHVVFFLFFFKPAKNCRTKT